MTGAYLVWLVSAIGVADLAADVVLLADHVVTDTLGVGVLKVGVEVDLAHTVADGIKELLLGAAGATVEDKENRLVLLGSNLLLDICLMLLKKFWSQLDVAGLVH